MIHYTPEGKHIKLGLNFSAARGGFRLLWAWYDFATHTAIAYRLRVRLHLAPRIIWEARRWSVIDSYMKTNGFEMVNVEVLQDLIAAEESSKRRSDSSVAIKTKFRAPEGVQ